MRKPILLLILFSILTFSEFLLNPTKDFNFTLNNNIKFNLSFSYGYWNVLLIEKGGGAGTAINPAESGFYVFDKIPSILNWEIFLKKDNFIFYTNIPFSKEKTVMIIDPFTNFFLKNFRTPSFDMNGPENFLLAYADNKTFLGIGRYPIKWGNSIYPISISDTTFQDNITFSKKIDFFKYTYHLISSFPLLTTSEKTIQETHYDSHTPGLYFSQPYKTIIAHRFDFFLYNLRIGIGEINVVGGKFLDLIDINPLMFFHNTYGEGYSNVLASIDFMYNLKKFNIFGEFVLDDFNGPTEIGSNYKPNAYGYNLGVSYKDENLKIWGEYDFTSEWMYITNYLPYLRVNIRHFYLDNNHTPGRALIDFPLGFKYGPDATMVSLGIDYKFKSFNLSFVYNHLIKGCVNDNGVDRWKWFWDSWPNNVSPKGNEIANSKDLRYNIFDLLIKFYSFSINLFKINENILFIANIEVDI
ncbi:hypothetical protein SU69_01160 [Thermosipho melanesiensis]|uniref:Capsule assembly Wzi family protein n=2 Tax=Thermosipho melanesiensis TaxID=46541 RepID=A6LJJ0_THEM4|nr:hypothetical protein [Thermosipho melanesiensis]ABR30091.1 hypothetical protein Tmel_0217 [Thermosipho melanesiensis BI429]APT73288.1 hypothetical protein BW47_01200 [Thermosipho melanesiensis]OOC38680.1 hypothetical protein SU68_01160 [Thermosipho melanesiensis]OOC40484.1 hypothetical protein SU70_01160 [Thermosipho melanesiensis]OOC40749.1 hypothetical protein SU69_01160 [Thermosipho melanesiensis]